MPFVGFVVNRVHPDPAREARSPRRGTRPASSRSWPPASPRRCATSRRWPASSGGRGPAGGGHGRAARAGARSSSSDVHDLRGLAEFGELIFAGARAAPRTAAATVSVRIVLYSGKGGVGQDEPLRRHRRPRGQARPPHARRLHRLRPQPGRRPRPAGGRRAHRASCPNLDAVEIDVNQELSSHWGMIQEWLTRFMTFQGVDETVAEEMAILPGHGGAVQPAPGEGASPRAAATT